MFEIKKGKTQVVPVRMFNSNGDAQLGITYTSVTASLLYADNTIVALGISASAWFEASGSAFSGLGTYNLQIHSASVSKTGSVMYAVGAGPAFSAVTFLGSLTVVDVDGSDVFNALVSVSGAVDRLKRMGEGRWKIDAVTNKMTFYESNGTTSFMIFGLSGSDGLPTTNNPFERNPVG